MRSNTPFSTLDALPTARAAFDTAPSTPSRLSPNQSPKPMAAMGTAQTRAPQPPWLAGRNGDARL